MTKSESKFYNTAIKMQNALIELLEKKDFSDISIVEICQKADVNRSTFYSHYQNTYDLLTETHQSFIKRFFDSFDNDFTSISDLSADESIFISPEYLVPYLEFVKANRRIFKVYMNNLNQFNVEELYSLFFDKVFVPVFDKNGITDKTLINYMARFYLQGITAITTEWINNNCEDDTLFICEIIILCVRPSFH